MPSIRNGMTIISTMMLKEKNAPYESEPPITMRPPTRITAACASSGRNESSGT